MFAELGMVLAYLGHRLADRAGYTYSCTLGCGCGSPVATTQANSARQLSNQEIAFRVCLCGSLGVAEGARLLDAVLGVVDDCDGRRIEELRWQLVPHWAKELNTRFSLINARAETLDQRAAYRRLVARASNRCLILAVFGVATAEPHGATRWRF